MLSLKTHNIMDYIVATVLILSPFLMGFSDVAEAKNLFLFLGIGLAAYSLITKYYYSFAKIIPLGAHMAFDVTAGLLVIVAPYVFNYAQELSTGQIAWHWIMGLGAMGLVALTATRTEKDKTPEQVRLTSGHSYHQNRPHQVR